MRKDLPPDHGLPDFVVKDKDLMPKVGAQVSITDAQYEALKAGVAVGKSILVVAPTSTGKTLIAAWAIAAALKRGNKVVYLVTHRALAKQKFDELKRLFLKTVLDDDKANIVLATGDEVVDAEDMLPAAPLDAAILVATYEKYLGMLSASGIPNRLGRMVAICDEVQIVGDPNRGRNVEILLTLLKRARCGQVVALSAAIGEKDAAFVATWMGATLVRVTEREKILEYELRAPDATYTTSTSNATIRKGAAKRHTATLDIVAELLKKKERHPIIVFCMTKPQTLMLAERLAGREKQQFALFGVEPESNLESFLIHLMGRRCAIHNADLTEELRREVEKRLKDRTIDVVFATTTLAAGVNFPIATVVVASWKRKAGWGQPGVPIPASEFHNMAGRAGRLGEKDDYGLVVLSANRQDVRAAKSYLELEAIEPLTSTVDPERFDGLALQLLTFGFCTSEQDLFDFLSATLSATREIDVNRAGAEHWKGHIAKAVGKLKSLGFVEVA